MSQFQLLTAFTGTWGLIVPNGDLPASAVPYFAGLTSGGAYSLPGSWPASVSIDSGTGALTNDGTNAGTYAGLKLGITVGNVLTKTPPFTLVLEVPDLDGVPTSAAGYFGGSAPGGTYALDGVWPDGITVDPNTGILSGTADPGVYPNLRVGYTVNGVTTYTNLFTITVPVSTASRVLMTTSGGTVHYSDDNGTSWSSAGAVLPARLFASVFNNGTWIAYVATGLDNAIYTSSDGLTWTQRTIDTAGYTIHSLSVIPGTTHIVAIGEGAFASVNVGVWHSFDNGSSWGAGNFALLFKAFNSLGDTSAVYLNDRLVYTDSGAAIDVSATSITGTVWTPFTLPGTFPSRGTHSFYVNGLYVFMVNNGSYAGNTYWTTPDFTTFTARTGPTAIFKCFLGGQTGMAVPMPSNEVLVLVSTATFNSVWELWKTADGINWTFVYAGASNSALGILKFGTTLLIRDVSGTVLHRSLDSGATWGSIGSAPASTQLRPQADQPDF